MHERPGIVALVFGIAFSASLQAQEQTDAIRDGADNEQESSNGDGFGIPIRIIEDSESSKARERRERESEQREKEDLAAQQGMNAATQDMNKATQSMKWASWLSTVFVAIGTALLVWTLRLTRQANEAAQEAVKVTRDIGKRQLRAYVTVEVNKGILLGENRREMRVQITLKNTGQTPAKNVRSASGICVKPYYLSQDAIIPPDDAPLGGSRSTIAVGDSLVVNREFLIPSREQIRSMAAKKENIYVCGAVFYEDVFDETWQTNFCIFVKNNFILDALDGPIGKDGNGGIIDGSAFTRGNQCNDIT